MSLVQPLVKAGEIRKDHKNQGYANQVEVVVEVWRDNLSYKMDVPYSSFCVIIIVERNFLAYIFVYFLLAG